MRYRYYVRCLPNNFPDYTFTRYRPVSPEYFSVDRDFNTPSRHYGIIFNNRGVPIWWYDAPAQDTKVLPNGNVLWFDRSFHRWEIHRLDGSLVRTLDAVGPPADPHDLQPLEQRRLPVRRLCPAAARRHERLRRLQRRHRPQHASCFR